MKKTGPEERGGGKLHFHIWELWPRAGSESGIRTPPGESSASGSLHEGGKRHGGRWSGDRRKISATRTPPKSASEHDFQAPIVLEAVTGKKNTLLE